MAIRVWEVYYRQKPERSASLHLRPRKRRWRRTARPEGLVGLGRRRLSKSFAGMLSHSARPPARRVTTGGGASGEGRSPSVHDVASTSSDGAAPRTFPSSPAGVPQGGRGWPTPPQPSVEATGGGARGEVLDRLRWMADYSYLSHPARAAFAREAVANVREALHGAPLQMTGSSSFQCEVPGGDMDYAVVGDDAFAEAAYNQGAPAYRLDAVAAYLVASPIAHEVSLDTGRLFQRSTGLPKKHPVLTITPLRSPTMEASVDLTYGSKTSAQVSDWVNDALGLPRATEVLAAPEARASSVALDFLRLQKLWAKRRELPAGDVGATPNVAWSVAGVYVIEAAPCETEDGNLRSRAPVERRRQRSRAREREEDSDSSAYAGRVLRLLWYFFRVFVGENGLLGGSIKRRHHPEATEGHEEEDALLELFPSEKESSSLSVFSPVDGRVLLSNELSVATQLAFGYEFARAQSATRRGDMDSLFSGREPVCRRPQAGDVCCFFEDRRGFFVVHVASTPSPFFSRSPHAPVSPFRGRVLGVDLEDGALRYAKTAVEAYAFPAGAYVCRFFLAAPPAVPAHQLHPPAASAAEVGPQSGPSPPPPEAYLSTESITCLDWLLRAEGRVSVASMPAPDPAALRLAATIEAAQAQAEANRRGGREGGKDSAVAAARGEERRRASGGKRREGPKGRRRSGAVSGVASEASRGADRAHRGGAAPSWLLSEALSREDLPSGDRVEVVANAPGQSSENTS
jgi:hypothetical protein